MKLYRFQNKNYTFIELYNLLYPHIKSLYICNNALYYANINEETKKIVNDFKAFKLISKLKKEIK